MQGAGETILSVLGAIAAVITAGGILTAFAFWLFKLFGDKWLTNKFAERLAAFRHEQSKDLEQHKFEINKLMDRATKLHQREFEVLPEAWSLLVKSYNSARGVVSPLQSYPDVGRMHGAQLTEFLDSTPFADWQKQELRESSDVNRYYQDAIFAHRLHEANAANREFILYLMRCGIFMQPEMKERFQALDDMIMNALIEARLNKQFNDRFTEQRASEKRQLLFDAGAKLFTEIEQAVSDRLWK